MANYLLFRDGEFFRSFSEEREATADLEFFQAQYPESKFDLFTKISLKASPPQGGFFVI
jgi:hypothetical protein